MHKISRYSSQSDTESSFDRVGYPNLLCNTTCKATLVLMIGEMQNLLDEYWKWLRRETDLQQIDGWIQVTTPYLDRHNDYLTIYVTSCNGRYLLTDDGYIVEDLEQSGCRINSPKRRSLFETTLNGFGIQVNEETNALEVWSSKDEFALKKHNIVQAMLAVNDFFYLATPITSLFPEEVASWLNINNIRYTPDLKLTGQSGYDHRFDFVIPKSSEQPERIIRAINRPTRDTTEAIVFSWMDTRETRSPNRKSMRY